MKVILFLVILFSANLCHANTIEGFTLDQWANAIYKAENSKRHPYGILVRYKHTTPRQACINTVRNKYKQWVKNGRKGKFLNYLASKYAPIGVSNDPTNLNKNWPKNVQYYLAKG